MLCRVDESNTMSVTMLLRRSPELEVATLEGMNLISSSTLSQPTTPPSRAHSPQHAMSNNTSTPHPEHMSIRGHPKGRTPVVPHIIHLRDLQGDATHADLGSQVEGNSKSWHSAQHSRSTEHMSQHAQHGGVNAQHARSPNSMYARSSSPPSLPGHLDSSPGEAAFDLCHSSQKLVEQLPTGMKQELSHSSTSAEGAALGQGRPVPYSRASSISPTGDLTMGGAYSIQGPALDTDAVGAEAEDAAASGGAQGCCSPQPSALRSQLSGRSSTVRFMLDMPGPDEDPNIASMAPIAEDDAEHARHAVLQSQHAEDAVPHEVDGMWASDKCTLSLSSTAGSLKGVLKKTASRESAATLSSDIIQALNSHGISFAFGAGDEDSSNEDAMSAMQSSALLKQGSESFPSWLIGG